EHYPSHGRLLSWEPLPQRIQEPNAGAGERCASQWRLKNLLSASRAPSWKLLQVHRQRQREVSTTLLVGESEREQLVEKVAHVVDVLIVDPRRQELSVRLGRRRAVAAGEEYAGLAVLEHVVGDQVRPAILDDDEVGATAVAQAAVRVGRSGPELDRFDQGTHVGFGVAAIHVAVVEVVGEI